MGWAGASLGRSWALLGRFLGLQNQALLKESSQMGSKRPSGSIVGRFGKEFGRKFKGFGKVWKEFHKVFGLLNK